MSGEDKAMTFFGDCEKSLEAFKTLKEYIGEFCPQANILIQDSLLAFKTNASFAYVSKTSDNSFLFDLAVTSRKKSNSQRLSTMAEQIQGTSSYIYHIPIKSGQDIDSDVKSLIRQSYEYSKLSYR